MRSNESIARVVHCANQELQRQAGEFPSPAWDACPPEMHASTVEGVSKARHGAAPAELHESWCQFKREHGWIWGAEKNADTKTHPCLVPYDELPTRQRVKDAVFAAIVGALS